MYMGRHSHGRGVHSNTVRDRSKHDILGLQGLETSNLVTDKSVSIYSVCFSSTSS